MTLNSGDRLGPYEVLSLIGAGGMGEVYKARDTRLGRTVALKVAKADFTERFEREARAVAALNHPNICSLYDVGPNYLVMEYLAGERLHGPVPVETALVYAGQICDALSAAHAQGIIHRDLKPANIMITKSGVKVLDFGLAKIGNRGDTSDDATVRQESLTQSGIILGTPAYMAPEQIEGHDVDGRTDIFALGCIVYELLTGRNAFQGKSAASLIAAILKEEPAGIRNLMPDVSPGLERVVARCLAKDPDARWQNAQDVKHAMADARLPLPIVQAGSRKRSWIAAFAAGILLATALTPYVLHQPLREADPLRLKIAAPPAVEFLRAPNRGGIALSPDGHLVAFTGVRDGQIRLWIQPLVSSSARELPGSEHAHLPFWSPDSRSLGFFAEGKLKRIDADGGRLQTLADAPVPQGGAWSRDGVILFSPDYQWIYKISATGGTPVLVKDGRAIAEDASSYAPQFLEDGTRFLHWVQTRKPDVTGVYAGSLKDPQLTVRLGSFGSWVIPAHAQGSDYLIWARGDTVVAQPWDSRSISLKGDPIPLGGPVGVLGSTPELAVSENGLLVYGAPVELQLTWVDRNGRTLAVVGDPGFISSLRLSPDGRKVVYRRNIAGGDPGLLIADLMRGTSSRLSLAGSTAAWSLDSSEVAYDRVADGVANIAVRRADGTGNERPVAASSETQHLIDWLHDGSILYYETNRQGQQDLRISGIAPGNKPSVLRTHTHREPEAQISPDGRWFAYASDESKRLEIYVESFNVQPHERGQRWQVSSKGGTFPRWRPDGRELFYVSTDGELMSVDVQTKAESIELTPPRSLFSLPAVFNGSYSYDTGADGERFLIIAVSSRRGREPLSVIVNWPALLSRK